MARIMLKDVNILYGNWKKVVHTTMYILNRVKVRVNHSKIFYEIWHKRPATIKYFKIFERKCYMRRDQGELGKFESRAGEGIFLGY